MQTYFSRINFFHFFSLDGKETKQRKDQEKTMLPPHGSRTLAVFSGLPYSMITRNLRHLFKMGIL
jgi:hypothetical protein